MSRHLFNDRSQQRHNKKKKDRIEKNQTAANKLIDGCRSEMEMPLQLAEFSGVRMAWQYWHSCDHNGILWAVHWDISYTYIYWCKVARRFALIWLYWIRQRQRAQLGYKSKTSSKFVSPLRPKQHLGIDCLVRDHFIEHIWLLLGKFNTWRTKYRSPIGDMDMCTAAFLYLWQHDLYRAKSKQAYCAYAALPQYDKFG